jgi:hypothetical protein
MKRLTLHYPPSPAGFPALCEDDRGWALKKLVNDTGGLEGVRPGALIALKTGYEDADNPCDYAAGGRAQRAGSARAHAEIGQAPTISR